MSAANPVGRRDLRKFHKDIVALILWAQGQGARVKISVRGHALLYGPHGTSACISANATPYGRAAQNNLADIRRLFKETP